MLWFWVVVLVLLIGAIAVVASGRGDAMAEAYDDRPDVAVPASRPLTADDLAEVRFNTGVRGYRMDEVDALLARLQAEMLERDAAEREPESSGSPQVTRVEQVDAVERLDPVDDRDVTRVSGGGTSAESVRSTDAAEADGDGDRRER